MKRRLNIVTVMVFAMVCSLKMQAQGRQSINGYLVLMCIYNGDTIPRVQLRTAYILRPLGFKNEEGRLEYHRLVRNVREVYPISKKISQAIVETHGYLRILPNEKVRQKYLKQVGKGLKEQYTARMKKFSFTQGKLLIRLTGRQNNSISYELVKAFTGPFRTGFYQTFATLFGAGLRKEYDPLGEDKLTERVVLLIENRQIRFTLL